MTVPKPLLDLIKAEYLIRYEIKIFQGDKLTYSHVNDEKELLQELVNFISGNFRSKNYIVLTYQNDEQCILEEDWLKISLLERFYLLQLSIPSIHDRSFTNYYLQIIKNKNSTYDVYYSSVWQNFPKWILCSGFKGILLYSFLNIEEECQDKVKRLRQEALRQFRTLSVYDKDE